MKDSIQNAYENIHARNELKEKTKLAVAKTLCESVGIESAEHWGNGSAVKRLFARRRGLVVAAASLIFLLTGCGAWTGYHIPTALISVDINPSLELGINCFDRVVSVTGYNEDGNDLAAELDIKYCKYEEAMCRLLEHGRIEKLMSEEGVLTIVVSGRNEGQCRRVRQGMDLYVEGQENVYCYRADSEEVAQAHHLGMTCGRYRVYQILSELCPELTMEEICKMTMAQAYDRIEAELAEKKAELAEKNKTYEDMKEKLEDLWTPFGGHHGNGPSYNGGNSSGNGNGYGGGKGHHGGQ